LRELRRGVGWCRGRSDGVGEGCCCVMEEGDKGGLDGGVISGVSGDRREKIFDSLRVCGGEGGWFGGG